MNKNISISILQNKVLLITFCILCSLFMFENVFSRKHWNRSDNVKIGYNPDEECVVIDFDFYDYDFGVWGENGYLEWLDIYYSLDGENYSYLMRAETKKQSYNYLHWSNNCSWVNLKNKNTDAILQFSGCRLPEDGTFWDNNVPVQRVEVYHQVKANVTIKWYIGKQFENLKYIKLNGHWHVTTYPDEKIKNEVFDAKALVFPFGDLD